MEPKASACKSCGAQVHWVLMEITGARCPVDAEPDARDVRDGGGNLVLTLRRGELYAATFVVETHGFARRRFNSHFKTCPNAAKHSKKRPR